MNKRGKLVVIDGIDGTGKATQVELLVGRLNKLGWRVKAIDFPRYNDNFFGKLLRQCLDGRFGDFLALDPRIASTLYAADRWESKGKIEDWLKAGYLVVADRYASANQIHQGSKIDDPDKRAEFLKWLDAMEHKIFGIPRPDLIIFLDLPIEVSQQLLAKRYQGGAKDQAESDLHHMAQTRKGAQQLVAKRNNWVRIDCAPDGKLLTKSDIHVEIIDALKRELKLS